MFHLAIYFLVIVVASAIISDPADIDPLTVLIKEIKDRMQELSENIEKDIAIIEKSKGVTSSRGARDFPKPEPLFDEIFAPEQLNRIEKTGNALNGKLDHRARTTVDRLLFLNENGIDITGPSGGYHRSVGGGYLAPHQYVSSNVHWQSYRDEGRDLENIDELGRVIV